jgi:NADP-dependent 3-hydroxy acid dehydrogenase YdfG
VARCLIIGCGCRGRSLACRLIGEGHAVRGTTRASERLPAIEATGAEAVLADPDRVATLASALEHVGVAYVLMANAAGPDASVAALHGPRLEMLLQRMLDSTVRGIVYEARGAVDAEILRSGAERVRAFCEDSRIPYCLLEEDPGEPGPWLAAAVAAAGQVLAAR